MKSSEIRQKFIDYFSKHGHTPVASSALIPDNDPTLLFINAGMNQFKNTFLGLEKRDYTRASSSQKCVRAGGKHNDLENVGHTARHHTFFEMLGNFSFGDYFKKEAIHFAWDFLTNELKIPKDKLYVTVFEDDDEAAEIWKTQENVPADRIFRFGEKDNFWRMGDTGPCGPCSEIFYDHGPDADPESDPYKGIASGKDRFIEIWNLVFMQFYEEAPGKMTPLPNPSIDTGAGLERLAAVMQGNFINYNTDLFMPLIEKVSQISGTQYAPFGQDAQNSAMRVLADHARATTFLIADGVLPSNEGRGYVLRRIMRRAIRYGRNLTEKSLLPELIHVVIDQMAGAYPYLKERSELILTTTREEEHRFLQTLDTGTEILNQALTDLKTQGQKQVDGKLIFKLYDTFGFPIDLTRLMAEEQGFTLDENSFEIHMEEARQKARASWKGKGLNSDETHLVAFTQKAHEQQGGTNFTGYDNLSGESEILFLSNGKNFCNSLNEGESGFMILSQTPFYAESGGQTGDVGQLESNKGVAQVYNCTKQNEIHLHHVEVQKGVLTTGEKVATTVEASYRRNVMKNHSATHLLHSALREVIGTHVTQAGSLVESDRLRFDFTHNKPLSREELDQIEEWVQRAINHSSTVDTSVMDQERAKDSGALMLFGEKYGDKVRVITMGNDSIELCGGTHVPNTSVIGFFKIVSESGVSSGVRRIEAISGDVALRFAMKHIREHQQAKLMAGSQESWTQFLKDEKESLSLSHWIEEKRKEIKQLDKELKKIKGSQIDIDQMIKDSSIFKSDGQDCKLVTADLEIDDRQILSDLSDKIRDKVSHGVTVLLGHGENSHPILVSVSKNLTKQIKAGQLLKEIAAALGGKGGGRPDFAQGAVPERDPHKAFQKALELLS